jgi:hypothetical protein
VAKPENRSILPYLLAVFTRHKNGFGLYKKSISGFTPRPAEGKHLE